MKKSNKLSLLIAILGFCFNSLADENKINVGDVFIIKTSKTMKRFSNNEAPDFQIGRPSSRFKVNYECRIQPDSEQFIKTYGSIDEYSSITLEPKTLEVVNVSSFRSPKNEPVTQISLKHSLGGLFSLNCKGPEDSEFINANNINQVCDNNCELVNNSQLPVLKGEIRKSLLRTYLSL